MDNCPGDNAEGIDLLCCVKNITMAKVSKIASALKCAASKKRTGKYAPVVVSSEERGQKAWQTIADLQRLPVYLRNAFLLQYPL